MLKTIIDQDLTTALKAKNSLIADTLRGLKTRIKNEEISKQKEFYDEEILPLISSEMKRRKDSVEAYSTAGRAELAEKEQKEIAVLAKYLPEQLSEIQVREIIKQALAGQNFAASDFGKAMAAVMPKLKGKADGSLVSKILKEKLK